MSNNELGPIVPKNTKSVDDMKDPIELVKRLLAIADHTKLMEFYEIPAYDTIKEFLENVAKRHHFYIKGGFLNIDQAARQVIQHVINGEITYEIELE